LRARRISIQKWRRFPPPRSQVPSAGHELGFERVFEEHVGFVFRVLERYGVAEREREDACQEVFLVVFRSLDRFERRSSLKTWIYGICRRVAASFRERAANRRELPSAVLPEPDAPAHDGGEAALAAKESYALLQELLARLSDEQREVFVLYELEELPMREIAELQSVPLQTAFDRLYAARAKIEAALKRLRAQRRVA
jgi:RNA polymerase sigma-70 factor (ECF subfamily)